MWEFPRYGLLGCPSCGHIRTMPLGLLTTWAYSPLALWGPNTWAIQLLRRLDFSSFFLIHLSNHLSLLYYWISVSTELNALATFTTEATLVCQEASSHPAGPPSHGKGPLSSVIWEISLWCVTQSEWGSPGWKFLSPQHLPLFFLADPLDSSLELSHLPGASATCSGVCDLSLPLCPWSYLFPLSSCPPGPRHFKLPCLPLRDACHILRLLRI